MDILGINVVHHLLILGLLGLIYGIISIVANVLIILENDTSKLHSLSIIWIIGSFFVYFGLPQEQ